MKKYRNGRLVDMTASEIEGREAHVSRHAERVRQREREEALQKSREQALIELADAYLKR